MRLIFLLAPAICWLNALLVAWDAINADASFPILGAWILVGMIFLALGTLIYLVQLHLFRSLGWARQNHISDVGFLRALARLCNCLAILAAAIALFSVICLTAILSRFNEGYHLFG